MRYHEPIDLTTPELGDLYDELPLWSAPFGLELLDRVPVRPGLTILDVGCGTGFLSIELAERCGPSTKVIAVDPWKAAMERLRRKIDQRRLDNIVLLEQDASTIDLPAGSVDVIVSNLGINNFEDPPAVLRACALFSKPGADLLLTTNLVGHMAEFYDVFRQVLIDTGQRDRLDALDANIEHRGTAESVSSLLRTAGFEVGEVVTKAFRLRYADGSAFLRHFFVRFGFVQSWTSIVSADSVPATFERLESELNAVAAARGELALTVPVACFVARKAV